MTDVKQVNDDPHLLQKMMSDMDGVDDLYRPTNYWEHYERLFLPELQKKGLRDFRRRRNSILNSFGAADLAFTAMLRYEGKRPIMGMSQMIKVLSLLLEKMHIRYSLSESSEQITKYFYALVKRKFDEQHLDIHRCPTTDHGNPEDLIVVDDGMWSFAHLQICSIFVDAFRDITFRQDMVFCEIGPGLGRNIEVIAKLYEDATFLVFDIPPQLYVANQYLSSVFQQRVLTYEDAIKIDPQNVDKNYIKGRILLLPSWKMPAWANTKIDVFWNSASFQEMEPSVVRNYLALVRKMDPDFIYINTLPGGNYWGEWKEGMGGIKEPILEENYFMPLGDRYALKNKYYTDYFFEPYSHISYIFAKRM